jgi:lipopolysaccharide export system permease protein
MSILEVSLHFWKSSILTRSIFKEVSYFFAITLFAFTGLLFILRVLRLSHLVVNKYVPAQQIALVFISVIPTFLEIALPLAALLGVMLAFARASGDSEVIVLKASGVSLTRLLPPLLVFGGVITLFGFFVSSVLKPWGYRTLDATLFHIAQTKSASGIESGVFTPFGPLTIYAEYSDARRGALHQVMIDDRRIEQERKVIFATKGTIFTDSASGQVSLRLTDGTIHERKPSGTISTDFQVNTLTFASSELISSDAQKGRSPRDMTSRELNDSIKELALFTSGIDKDAAPDSPQAISSLSPVLKSQLPKDSATLKVLRSRAVRLAIEKASRSAMPFAAIVLSLIAFPLGIYSPRLQRGFGVSLSALGALFIFLIYYGLFSLGLTLADKQIVSPYVALWIPNILCFVLALYFLWRREEEKNLIPFNIAVPYFKQSQTRRRAKRLKKARLA